MKLLTIAMEDNGCALCKANPRLWVSYKSKVTLKLAGVFSIRVAIFAFCPPASFTVGQGGYIYHCFVIRNEKWARRKELNKEEKQVRRVTTPPLRRPIPETDWLFREIKHHNCLAACNEDADIIATFPHPPPEA